MRKLPEEFIQEINNPTNNPIDLIAIEISPAFTSYCRIGTNSQRVTFDAVTREALAVWESENGINLDSDMANCIANLPSGTAWVLGCDEGYNAGVNRLAMSYTNSSIYFSGGLPSNFVFDSDNPDRVRLSKYLFLAVWNMPIDFFLPDSPLSTYSQPMVYLPFPMSIEPLGTNISFEVMDMSVEVSNVNRMVGNLVQSANGLRGNRVYHLKVFNNNNLLSNKDCCIKEVMYIDSISITPTAVSFKLESKFNIVDVQVPLRMFYRDFCGFTFKSPECGFGFSYGSMVLNSSIWFPMASTTCCDHTLRGPNGCLAHLNTARFGGFPTIPPTS